MRTLSILPNIVEVAMDRSLIVNVKTLGKKEVLFKCPFCREESKPQKNKKYYLSLNEHKNVFKCWFCKEYGGVVKFISLLDGVSESNIIENLRKKNGFNYKKHPAEKLSRTQLGMIGYSNINWVQCREFDSELYYKFREHVFQKWLSFLNNQKEIAYKQIYAGILSGRYKESIKKVKDMEQQIGVAILEDVLNSLSRDERTEEELQRELFVTGVIGTEHPSIMFTQSIAN